MIELTSYKLAQFVASYLKDTNREQNDDIETTKGIQEMIESVGIQDAGNPNEDRKKGGIRSCTARKWVKNLGFNWREVKKGVFFDGHERKDVVQDRIKFVEEMKKNEPYLVEFDNVGNVLEKSYPEGCKVGGEQKRPIILITHDESTFFCK